MGELRCQSLPPAAAAAWRGTVVERRGTEEVCPRVARCVAAAVAAPACLVGVTVMNCDASSVIIEVRVQFG